MTIALTNKSFPLCEVVELTDQFFDLHRKRYFLPDKDSDEHILTKEPVLCGAKEFSRLELQFFYLPLPLAQLPANLVRFQTLFPVENRSESPQQAKFVLTLLEKNKALPSYQRYADFHLLVFLANFLGLEVTSMIATAVSLKEDLPGNVVREIQSLASNDF